jgi:hypothetical protein
MVHSLDVIVLVQFNIGLLLRFFLEFHRSCLLHAFIISGCGFGIAFFFYDISSSSLINEAQHKNTFLNYGIAHTELITPTAQTILERKCNCQPP